MNFTPQRYKIKDEKGLSFIDSAEISEFLEVSPTEQQVQEAIDVALGLGRLSMQQTAVLLNAPRGGQQRVLKAASELKERVYGDRVVLFAPLYVGNLCSNGCDYCSFAVGNGVAGRKTLEEGELRQEVEALSGVGHKRLILVYGEHPRYSARFIADNVRSVYSTGKIRRLNINAAPFGVEGFREIGEAGIGTFQIFQESYNRDIYTQHHPSGMKADYDWRLTALDRAMEGGIDDVGIGALFGLNPDWREEVLGLVRHANHLEACYGIGPHTISLPRMTPAVGATAVAHGICDDDFLYLIAVLRLAVPYAGLILTARETPKFRNCALEYGVTQIDGGTKLEIGGYSDSDTGSAQFSLNDNRPLSEIIHQLVESKKIPSFCTACYRKGRTGEHFMTFSTKGHIKKYCTANAILSFAEYLMEAEVCEELKQKGNALIDSQLQHLENAESVRQKLEKIRRGETDLFF